MAKTLYLIDGHAQFFRAYHAIRPGTMSSPVTKEPTNLSYGFSATLIKLLREHQPHYLAVAIDVSGDRASFRSEIYPAYKANRPPVPEDFHMQVERCLEMLNRLNVPVVGVEGVEADDVIATLVEKLEAAHPDLSIRVISRDKDLTQLLSERTELFDIHKDEVVTPSSIFKTEGVTADQVRDILALMGDTVDNVPGVPGIGPKTAAKLILAYGSIENLYAHLDEIKGKRHEHLAASREQVEISRQLVELRTDFDVDFDLEDASFEPSSIDVEAMAALFRELGFHRQIEEIRKLAGSGAHTPTSDSSASFGENLFEDATVGHASAESNVYECVMTEAALLSVVDAIREAGHCALDTETDGLSSVSSGLCGLSVSIEPRSGYYIPIRSPEPDRHLDLDTVVALMRPVLENPSIEKTGHNLKFDINVLRAHGVHVAGVAFDTMIASYVLDATRSSHSLDALALAHLNHTCIPISQLIGTGKRQTTFDHVPLDQASTYAAEDADITFRLRRCFEGPLEDEGLRTLFDDVEMPLVEVLAELEHNGIRVDGEELDRQREALQEQIDDLRSKIIDASPVSFNPDSPKQLAAVLFNKPDQEPPGLGLRATKRGKTGPSTDVEVLEKLAADPEVTTRVPDLIVEYRQLTKLVGTYLQSLKDAINPRTGRIHASFNQTVAATGRLSSSDPNLQNIPIRTSIGREIRRAFIAEPGNQLITADYSQIELRVLAHLSGDEALVQAFHDDADIHRAVAAQVFETSPEEVSAQQRNSAKMINFGIVYGITPYGLSRRLGGDVSVERATAIIADYKARFPGINAFLDACVHHAEEHGYVETILKRRRLIPQVHARNPRQQALGHRMAINTVVQGSAADLIKLAMIDLYRALPMKFNDARMLLQIHDELVLEAPAAQAHGVRDFVVDRMEAAMSLRVPLKVQSAVSDTWIDAK